MQYISLIYVVTNMHFNNVNTFCFENFCNFFDNLFYNNIFQKIKNPKSKSKIKIALAVSGGADSMCMAIMMNQYLKIQLKIQKNFNIEIHCVIIDHKLRIESTIEANQVKATLEKYKLQSTILTWLHEEYTKKTQQAARNARYALLIQFCKNNNIQYLCTAHTMDDQAETLLMRIMRGTGVDGICGMQTQSTISNIVMLKPMLNISRKEIEVFLLENGNIKYVNDPSNYLDKYDRTNVRKIMKFIEDKSAISTAKHLKQRLILLADNAQRTKSYIDEELNKSIKRCALKLKKNHYFIYIKELHNIHDEMLYRMLRKLLIDVNNSSEIAIAEINEINTDSIDINNNISIRLKSLKLIATDIKNYVENYMQNKKIIFKKRTLNHCIIKKTKCGNIEILKEENIKKIKKMRDTIKEI